MTFGLQDGWHCTSMSPCFVISNCITSIFDITKIISLFMLVPLSVALIHCI